MGRSVDYLSNAQGVTYFTNDPTNENGKVIGIDDEGNDVECEPNEDDYQFSFDNLEGNITHTLIAKYPSLSQPSKSRWGGRETRIILENRHCEIGISEYCGLVSISIRVHEYLEEGHGIAEAWISRVWSNMVTLMKENTYHDNLRKVATFSNGEGVYELN